MYTQILDLLQISVCTVYIHNYVYIIVKSILVRLYMIKLMFIIDIVPFAGIDLISTMVISESSSAKSRGLLHIFHVTFSVLLERFEI